MLSTASQMIGPRVLLVDSHEDSLWVATVALEHMRCSVWPSKTARQAMQALSCFEIDILISELRLPGEDGYDLMRQVKAYAGSQNQSIPAIAPTTQISDEARAKALAVGFCRYLTKPYSIDALGRMVAELSHGQAGVRNHYHHCESLPA